MILVTLPSVLLVAVLWVCVSCPAACAGVCENVWQVLACRCCRLLLGSFPTIYRHVLVLLDALAWVVWPAVHFHFHAMPYACMAMACIVE